MDSNSVNVCAQTYTPHTKRRTYGRDFKLQAMRRMEQGRRPAQVARDIGVSRSMVARWMRELQRDAHCAFRGQGRRKPLQTTVKRLENEIERLKAEKELLKKASARFALKPSQPSVSSQSIEQCGR